jgi:alkanesulfonate monooxygenase SsuD/methylene tetrahydromethanopterin reductase-like flavin-dependent oxidoreductase (luciferase family)
MTTSATGGLRPTSESGSGPSAAVIGTPKLPRFGLYYDFRNPAFAGRPFSRLYAEIFEQAAWAEKALGFGSCWISEHHLAVDGYTPSPLPLAAAIATRTERMKIGTSILILPLQHPIRLAEDALTVNAISGGRFMLGVGLGYRSVEFEGFGIPMAERRGRLEEGLEILRNAFAGRTFVHRGKHFDFGELTITPLPDPGAPPELWIGGFAPVAIARGARMADGMVLPIPALWSRYRSECAKGGRVPRIAAGYHWILGDDPEKELAAAAPYLMHQVNEYGAHGAYGPPADWQPIGDVPDLMKRSPYELKDAEGAAEVVAEAARAGVEDVHWWTVFPGEPIERSSARLEYFTRKVVPLVRQKLGLA